MLTSRLSGHSPARLRQQFACPALLAGNSQLKLFSLALNIPNGCSAHHAFNQIQIDKILEQLNEHIKVKIEDEDIEQ